MAKRHMSQFQSQQPPSKKRVALGEISTNVIGNPNLPDFKKAVLSPHPDPTTPPLDKTPPEDVLQTDNIPVSDDPHLFGPYVSTIYYYLLDMEKEDKRRPLSDYMHTVQNDVTSNMRGVLVDWLVELAQEFELVSETLYLTVSYIDRYLSFKPIHRDNLQLLGVSAMLIASKYEEIDPEPLESFCDMTENTYTIQQVINMEADILRTLKYEMGNPNVNTFLRKFTKAAHNSLTKDSDLQMEFLCNYLAELSLLDYGCVKFLPSTIAASVVFLAKSSIQPKERPWTSSLESYTGYKASDLKECVLQIHELQIQKRGGSLETIRNKYKQHKFKSVSTLTFPLEVPASFFEDVKDR